MQEVTRGLASHLSHQHGKLLYRCGASGPSTVVADWPADRVLEIVRRRDLGPPHQVGCAPMPVPAVLVHGRAHDTSPVTHGATNDVVRPGRQEGAHDG